MDSIMEIISGTAMWLPLYALILVLIWRKYGWQRTLAFILCLALAIGLSDMICGIFKHSGPLKNLWESFPVRHRPMFDSAVRDLAHVPSYKHGAYGTVSAHAATTVSLAWMSQMVYLAYCDIGSADLLFAHLPCLSLPYGYTLG